ncbi:MAG: hypothetical protein NTU41_14405 [Chloroflexi bacterium]|nr:hypothetical protein [Chloroflexota bacterium]
MELSAVEIGLLAAIPLIVTAVVVIVFVAVLLPRARTKVPPAESKADVPGASCTGCGTQTSAGDVFCRKCGVRLPESGGPST